MSGMTQARILASDRRRAAVHEAGHLVVGEHLGQYATSVWIMPKSVGAHGNLTWTGWVQFESIASLEPVERRLIGCAGYAAELRWAKSIFDADYWTDPDVMSESDWEMAGCLPGCPDEPCIKAIGRLETLLTEGSPAWNRVVQEARRLIVETRPFSGLKAERDRARAALERAKAHAGGTITIDPSLIEGFGRAMRENPTSGSVPFRKAYIQSVVAAVEVDDAVIRIKGSKDVLEQAVLASRSGETQCSQMSTRWRASPNKTANTYVIEIAL